MKASLRAIKDCTRKYVEHELEREREVYPDELNNYLVMECGVRIIDDELLQDLIKGAKKEIGFVHVITEEA
ncbi:hypothetical protein [Clostridium culturomicium]|uniref:hypothetical protein n=1 Tax=Clostridium culturomicium TaxID=1499683 RepID=UPI00058F0876|nr:hypothetical protein [Clostridium culturomicium]